LRSEERRKTRRKVYLNDDLFVLLCNYYACKDRERPSLLELKSSLLKQAERTKVRSLALDKDYRSLTTASA
jgi:hypothetical protein